MFREDTHCMQNMLCHLAIFLATPACNLHFELCDVRNYILLDHPTLKYIKPHVVDVQPSVNPCYGFYAEHGKPSLAVIVKEVLMRCFYTM